MKAGVFLLGAATALVAASPAMAATYIVNFSDGVVGATGSIETDGTLGLLVRSNITDWKLTIKDAGGSFLLNGSANSQLLFFGGPAFSATSTGLFFNFSGAGAVLFQNPTVGSGVNYLCLTSNALCGGGYNRISIGVSNFGGGIAQSGVQLVAGVSAVPEPAAWAMMIGGAAMAGGALRRRRVRARVRFA